MNKMGTRNHLSDIPLAIDMLRIQNDAMEETEGAVNPVLQAVQDQLDTFSHTHGFILMELPDIGEQGEVERNVLCEQAKELGYGKAGLCARDASVSVQLRGTDLNSATVTSYHKLGPAVPLLRMPLRTRILALKRLECLVDTLAIMAFDYAEAAKRLTDCGSDHV